MLGNLYVSTYGRIADKLVRSVLDGCLQIPTESGFLARAIFMGMCQGFLTAAMVPASLSQESVILAWYNWL